ncbi:MAG TPA: polymer-forming cytoskeletal protein [Woeseiaceae bacterium]|nr:polymer-forming cytoskeletal protein [Woeseiaceae bacterium]
MSHPYDMGDKKKVSVLGPTLKFKGELTASEDLLIQGQVEGSITHSSKLTIGPEGVINANVKADFIAVEGSVTGDLVATSSVVVTESSKIDGNIYSPTVTLREGAKFNGKIDMSGRDQPKAETAAGQEQGKRTPRHGDRDDASGEATADNDGADKKRSISAA